LDGPKVKLYLPSGEDLKQMNADIVVIGAGLVGSAIAYGLTGLGHDVLMLDGNDRDFRSANANFGLVWLHGKGMDLPAYQRLTGDSVDLWASFGEELHENTSIDLQYEQNGGLALCLGEAEYEKRRTDLLRLHNQLGGSKPNAEMIDRRALEKLLPHARLGSDVTGASFGYRDGHVNPLRLLAALRAGAVRRGGRLRGGSSVKSIMGRGDVGFEIALDGETIGAGRVVIAAGLGSSALAAQVGLELPIRPQRGQILVTERLEAFLPLPMMDVRQTREGTVMIGATNEETGLDHSTTADAAAKMSHRAIRQLPDLSSVRLVRQWAGLRILSPDGFPIYQESQTHPGAFVALCHSGVTLAPVHAGQIAAGIAASRLPADLSVFSQRRFDVPKAA
jgi:glycine/D-amino acid oxidase-like deaminating enzyme